MSSEPLVSASHAPSVWAREDRRLGPFRLVRSLGHGGFAPVWLADEVHDGRRLRSVAIKLFSLPPHVAPGSAEAARCREAILEEAQALCRVEHPNVVRLYSVQRADEAGVIGLVMEHVEGEDLFAALRGGGRLGVEEVLDAGVDVAWALAAVHGAGLVHRDVKPGNVVRGARGYKLVDFGIAAASPLEEAEISARDELTPAALSGPVTERVVEPRRLAGTPGYIAPECLLGGAEASPASDLFALGVTLFRVATGLAPAEASVSFSTRDFLADRNRGRALVPRLDASFGRKTPAIVALADLVATLLDPDPSARPRHAEAVARELSRIRALAAGDPRAAEPSWSAPRRLVGDVEIDGAEARATRTEATFAPASEDAIRTPVEAAARGGATTKLAEAHARRDATARPSKAPLVGRGDAVEAIERALAAAARGEPRFVLVTGHAGAGRTRMIEAAIERAAGFVVLRAMCSPERRSALRPLARALEASGEGAMDVIREAAARVTAPLDRGGSGMDEALEGVEAALLRAGSPKPLLLAIDDVQWADAHTLDLLRLLAERAGEESGGRLAVIAAARTEPAPSPRLRGLLDAARGRRRPGIAHVALGPLSPEDTAALARATMRIDADVERAVVRGSGGVPLLVVHALSAWRETGAIVDRGGVWCAAADPAGRETGAIVDRGGVWSAAADRVARETGAIVDRGGVWSAAAERPLLEDVPGVADLVEAQLAACFEPESAPARAALRALTAIALHGGQLPIEALLRVCGDDDDLERALDGMVAAGLLVVSGPRQEHGFSQEMARQAVLGLASRRPWFFRLHRALLDAVAAAPGADRDASFLAAGYEKLGARDEARAWLGRAAAGAAASGLFAECAELADRRAALLDDAERAPADLDVIETLLRGRLFEEASRRLQRISARAEVFPIDPRSAPGIRRRTLALATARGLGEPSPGDPSLIADADAAVDPALGFHARMAAAGVAPEEEGLRLAGEAIARAPDPRLELSARVLRFELNYASNRPDPALALEDVTRALAIADAVGSIWQRVHIEGDLSAIEAEIGQQARAIERLRGLLQRVEQLGLKSEQRLFSQNLAALLLRAGEPAEAAAMSRRTADLAAQAGDPVLRATALSLRAEALRRTGALDAALACATEAERLQEQRGDRMRALTLLRRAEILGGLGRASEALADARAAARWADGHGDRDLAFGALLWEKTALAEAGQIPREDLAIAIAEVTQSNVTLRALTIALLSRARALVTGA